MKTNSLRAGGATALLAFSALGLTGCEEVPDSVFLYFINGYPATSGITVISDSGPIVQDAQFGDRIGADGPCPESGPCLPIEVDRSFGTNLTFLLQGSVEPIETQFNLYAMYPQETGTLIFQRKSAESAGDVNLFRHVQTISEDCTFTLANALSTSDEFLTTTSFLMAPEFRVEPVSEAGFADEAQVPFLSQCGPLPTDAPEHEALARTDLLPQVQANPWFFVVPCDTEGSGDALCFGWGVPGESGLSKVWQNGEVAVVRNTFEYYQCVQSAITLLPTEEQMMSPFPVPQEQVACPDEPIQWEHVKVDAQAAAACNFPVLTQASHQTPGSAGSLSLTSSNEGFFCDFEFRVRSGGLDTIFGPTDDNDLGFHGPDNGDLVSSSVQVDEGSEHFYVAIGRPVNPIVWQWDSGDNFVNLNPSGSSEGYPYPNGQNVRVGDYDFEAQ